MMPLPRELGTERLLMYFRALPLLWITLALWATATPSAMACSAMAWDGQAKAKEGSRLEGLQLGELLYGTGADPKDHLGKIVLVNIGGG